MRRRIIPGRARRAESRASKRALRRLYEVTREGWRKSVAPLTQVQRAELAFPVAVDTYERRLWNSADLNALSNAMTWDLPRTDHLTAAGYEPDCSGVDDARAAAALNAREKARRPGMELNTRGRSIRVTAWPVVTERSDA